MLAADAHLCIDYGTATTTAMLSTPDGGWYPIVVGGVSVLPSGVWLDPATGRLLTGTPALQAARSRPETWLAEPLRHIAADSITLADATLDPIEAVSAVLGGIATHAAMLAGAPISRLTLVVPCWWGPRRRHQLRRAAEKTGLPAPRLIADAVAVAAHWTAWSGSFLPAGASVLVVNAGAGGIAIALVGALDDGVQLLAHHLVPDSDAATLDAALAEHLITSTLSTGQQLWQQLGTPERAVDRHQLLEAVRTGKEALGQQTMRTAIALPAPHPPATLDRDMLTAASAGLRQRLPAAMAQVLAAADTHRDDLTAVLLTGGHATLPGITDTVRETTGLIPTLLPRQDAAAEGALRIAASTGNPAPAAAVPEAPPPRIRSGWRALVTPGLLAIAAIALFAEALGASWVDTFQGRASAYFLRRPQLGVSGMLIALACWSTAMGITHLLHTAARTPGEQATSTRIARQALLTAAGTGLALAAGFGVYASAYMNIPRMSFAQWPILFALPIVILASTAGLLITRIRPGDIPSWVRGYRTPVLPALVAATGILITEVAASGFMPAFIRLGLPASTFVRLGMFVLGAGIGLAITRHRITRLIAATSLGLSFAVIYTWRTADHYHWAFAAVLLWWALTTAAVHTIRSASPLINSHWQRLIG